MRLHNALPLLLPLLLAVAPGLGAQAIRGELVEQGTLKPVDGAIVTLLAERGTALGGTLSDASGRFTLQVPNPGRFRVRADRIGYATTTSPLFAIGPGDVLEYTMAVSAQAIPLEGVVARGERRCRVRPEEGLLTARLLDEARKALRAAEITREQGLVRFDALIYERELDLETLRIMKQRTGRRSSQGAPPFRSAPPEWLAEHGYFSMAANMYTWYVPDARTLLSDPFLDTHCFHTEPGGDERKGLIGLAFRPIPGREVPEIRGVLWLDQETAELRYIEYGYVDTGLDVPMDRVAGRVEFRRLPAGAWIVERWWVRMPRIGVRIAQYTGKPYQERLLIGYKEDGGEVTHISARARPVEEAPAAVLVGTVFDSTRAVPLAGATVFLSGTAYTATTDAGGRFRLEGIPAGSYLLSFMHPRLDSLQIVPSARPVTLVQGHESAAQLAIPRGSAPRPEP